MSRSSLILAYLSYGIILKVKEIISIEFLKIQAISI